MLKEIGGMQKADDYVLATGKKITVREFVELAFAEVGIKIEWKGKGVDEKGINTKTGKVIVEVDPRYFRPTEVDLLIGDPSKAMKELGWKHKYTLEQLVKEMVASDIKLFERDKYLMEGGHDILNFHE
jgi:GDPmannose 4,6-dehydratase